MQQRLASRGVPLVVCLFEGLADRSVRPTPFGFVSGRGFSHAISFFFLLTPFRGWIPFFLDL
jgi:hypothetical protein